MFGTGVGIPTRSINASRHLNGHQDADNLFGLHVRNDKSRPAASKDLHMRSQHMIRGGAPDRAKYRYHGDPLQLEDLERNIKYGPAHLRKERLEEVKRDAVGAALKPKAEEGRALELGAIQMRDYLKKKEAEIDDEFASDFYDFCRGAGKVEEYEAAGWDPEKCRGKALTEHPSALRFLSDPVARHHDYNKKIAQMRLLGGRMSAESRRGYGMTIDDLYKYVFSALRLVHDTVLI
jgi:hypothetical protein